MAFERTLKVRYTVQAHLEDSFGMKAEERDYALAFINAEIKSRLSVILDQIGVDQKVLVSVSTKVHEWCPSEWVRLKNNTEAKLFNVCFVLDTLITTNAEWPWPAKYIDFLMVERLREEVERRDYPEEIIINWVFPLFVSTEVGWRLEGVSQLMDQERKRFFELSSLQFLMNSLPGGAIDGEARQIVITDQSMRFDDGDDVTGELRVSSNKSLEIRGTVFGQMKERVHFGETVVSSFSNHTGLFLDYLSRDFFFSDVHSMQTFGTDANLVLSNNTSQSRPWHIVNYKNLRMCDTTGTAISMVGLFLFVQAFGSAYVFFSRKRNKVSVVDSGDGRKDDFC